MLLRVGRNGRNAVAFFHVFNNPPELMNCPLPAGEWTVDSVYQAVDSGDVVFDGKELMLKHPAPFSGFAVLLNR